MAKAKIRYPYKFKKADFTKTKWTPQGQVESTRTPQFAYHVTGTGLDFMQPVIWRDTQWDWWCISDAATGATLTKVVTTQNRNEAVNYFVSCFSSRTEAEFNERIASFKAKPHNMALFIGS